MKIKKLTLRACTVTAVIMVLIAVLPVIQALAATSGPNNAGSGVSIGGIGTVAWSNPGNITTIGSPYATVSVSTSEITRYLRGTQYGFAIPAGSTINGITVVINRESTGTFAPFMRDNVVSLVKAGIITGNNNAVSGTDWPNGGLETATYGSASDLWGTTWTPADINSNTFGVVLSAVNANSFFGRTATVDYMQITVNYTPYASSTAVNCGGGTPTVTYGNSISCVATVTRSGGSLTPTGSVSWTSSGSGSFVTSPCALSGSGASATCSVTYTPSAVGSGSHLITATYSGDTNFSSSSGNQTVTVDKATPTLSVTNSPVVYDGTPQAADVTGSVPGIASNVLYDGLATVPTDAGTYAVTADFTPTDTTNYTSLSGASAGDFVINQATPTVSVNNSPVTYNGSPQAAVVLGSVPGTTSNVMYDGSATVPTDVGTYAVTADFTPTDATNYTSLSGASAGDFVINQATPTLSVTNSPVVYDGTPQAAVVTPSTAGVVSNVLYDGSAIVPTDAGTYAVTADFTPTDATNYSSLSGADAGNFVINQSTPILSVTNSPVVYDGTPQAAVVTSSTAGIIDNVLYDGSAIVPTDAGTYAVTADFTPSDTTNYTSLSGASAGNFVVTLATPTLSVTNSPVVYNGSPQAAVVLGSVPGAASNVMYDGSATVPTDAGTYAVTADFTPTDTTNYASLSGAAAGNFVITQVTPTVSVTNSPVTYNGSPQAAVVLGSVPGTASNVMYDGSATVPTDVGTYAVTADFTPTDTTNYTSLSGASAGNFVITQATPTLSVTNSPVVYNGLAQAAVLASSVTGAISNVRYDGSATVPTNAGTYAVTADFTPTDTTNYTSLTGASAGNFVITKATPTVSVTNSPVTYNGSPQAAVVLGSVVGTVSNVRYDGSATAPTNAGTYAVTADFTPTDMTNYNSLSGASAGNFVVTQATPTLSVTNSPVVFNGLPQAAVVTGSVAGTVSNIRYDGSITAPTDVGTYAVTVDFTPTDTTNYASLSGASAGNFVIGPAGPGLTLTKTAAPTTFGQPGKVINYTYLLTNTGDVTLAGPFTVADDKLTVTCPATASLAPAASINCTGSYTTTLADVLAGSVTNSATGSGSYALNPVVSNVAQTTIKAIRVFLAMLEN